jgi:hypothetical protein
MKTNCINWISAEINKPCVNIDNEFDRSNNYSCRVLTHITHSDGETRISFGRYIHNGEFWSIEGQTGGKYTVDAFAYLNAPPPPFTI